MDGCRVGGGGAGGEGGQGAREGGRQGAGVLRSGGLSEEGGGVPVRRSVGRSVGARAGAHTMSRRRRQERRRGRQPVAASRCSPRPGMARLGPARLTPAAGGSGGRGPALAWGAHAQRRDGAAAASEPSPRRCPGMKRRRAPGAGCCEPDKDSRGGGGGEGGGGGRRRRKGIQNILRAEGEREKTAPPSLLQQEKPAETRPHQSTSG